MTNIVHVPAEPGFYLAYKHVTPPSDFNDILHVIEVPEPAEGK